MFGVCISSFLLQNYTFFKSTTLVSAETAAAAEAGKWRVSWQLQAAILDCVKSPVSVTLYQQQWRDNRVRECLCGETPLQTSRETERERELILQLVLQKSLGGRRMQGLGPLQAIAGILLKLYHISYSRCV